MGCFELVFFFTLGALLCLVVLLIISHLTVDQDDQKSLVPPKKMINALPGDQVGRVVAQAAGANAASWLSEVAKVQIKNRLKGNLDKIDSSLNLNL